MSGPIDQPLKVGGNVYDNIQFLGLETGYLLGSVRNGPEDDFLYFGAAAPVVLIGLKKKMIIFNPADKLIRPGSHRVGGKICRTPFLDVFRRKHFPHHAKRSVQVW